MKSHLVTFECKSPSNAEFVKDVIFRVLREHAGITPVSFDVVQEDGAGTSDDPTTAPRDTVAPDPAQDRPQPFHEPGAELDRHIAGVLDRLERELPEQAHVSTSRVDVWRRLRDGERAAEHRWICVILPGDGTDAGFCGAGDTPDAAADEALATYQASAGADVASMADDELVAVVSDPAVRRSRDGLRDQAVAELRRRLDAAQRPAA